jgi:N6-L-threonylcarbamoyladenine synthase
MEKYNCSDFALCGGVAANSALRSELEKKLPNKKMRVFLPSLYLCGDNGSMIACAGYYRFINQKFSDFNDEVYARAIFKQKNGF